MRLVDWSVRYLFGDDIFVSYSRLDGAIYAAGLANQLTSRKFTCKLDQWGSQPGKEIPPRLKAALRRSSVVVLVGTSGAAHSLAVGQEIQEFCKTRRLIIPIDFNGSVRTANWLPAIEGLPLSNEAEAALRSGDPSPEVINRIEKSYTFRRKDQRLRAATVVTTVILAALLIAAGVAAGIAETARRNAVEQTRQAAEQTALADAAKRDARQQQAEAARQKAIAGDATLEATAQQEIAAEQKRIAEARQLLARAELERNRGEDPFVLPVRLALQAWSRYPTPEVEPILRYGLDRIPRLIADFPHPKAPKAVALRPDGMATTLCEDGAVRVWTIGSRDPVTVLHYRESDGPVALATDGTVVAIADKRTLQVYRVSISGAAVIGSITPARPFRALAFDPDTKLLGAADEDLAVRIWEIGTGLKDVTAFRQDKRKGEVLRTLQFSGDGTRLAVGTFIDGDDNDDPLSPVSVWSVANPKRIFGTGGQFVLDFTGSRIATSRGDTFWVNKLGGEEPTQLARVVEEDRITAMAFADSLLLAGSHGSVHIYDPDNHAKEIASMPHPEEVNSVRIEGDMQSPSITTMSGGKTVHQWLLDKGSKAIRLYESLRVTHKSELTAFAVRGRRIATASSDGHVRVWEKTYGGGVSGLENGDRPAGSTAIDLGGQARERLQALSPAGNRGTEPTLSKDGKQITIPFGAKPTLVHRFALPAKGLGIFQSLRNTYVLVKLDGKAGWLIQTNSGSVTELPVGKIAAFSPDERRLAVANGTDLSIIDTATGKPQSRLLHGCEITRVLYAPSSLRLATTCRDETLFLWTSDGRKLGTFKAVSNRAFSPSGHWLALSGQKSGISLVNSSDASVFWRLPNVWIEYPVFSHDEQYIAGYRNRTAQVLDVRHGTVTMSADFEDDIRATQFTMDSRRLSVAREHRIDDILIQPRDLVAEARARLAKL